MLSHWRLLYPAPDSSLSIHPPVLPISSVQLVSHVRLFATPWTAVNQASQSITNSGSPPKPTSIELVMPSNISSSVVPFFFCPQSFPAPGFFQMSQLSASDGQSIGVSASTSVPPINISFRMDWLDLLAVQGTLKSLLQHHSSKASILPYPKEICKSKDIVPAKNFKLILLVLEPNKWPHT